jgi:phosphoenolpyruvate---glycerone phosphotransferase subunit DhaK
MANLEEVARIAQKACANVRTMGVALSPCIVPEVGRPSFTIEDGEMEIGMGIHGEPGIEREPLKSADVIVQRMVDALLVDLPYVKGDEVAVLMNGLGATPKEELYIMYRKVNEILSGHGIKVYHTYVGEFATSMEMSGASISLFKLDSELKKYLSMPANTPFFEQVQL